MIRHTMTSAAILIGGALSSSTASAASTDAGLIADVYAGPGGYLAVMLPGGFPNAVASAECPGSKGWAGLNSDPANKDIKSLLMMAKASEKRVRIVIEGCEAGGAWFKISHVYVEQIKREALKDRAAQAAGQEGA